MRNLRLWINYDGCAYAGWQRQAGAPTIQAELERALELVTRAKVAVHGAGRTDAGVHALAQSAHARLDAGIPADRLPLALNVELPSDIRVLGAREVAEDFHARFSARAKRYAYRIRTDPVRPAVGRGYFHWHRGQLDLASMREAARSLVGEQDFAALATNPGRERKRRTVRRIHALHLVDRPGEILLVVEGNGFLYNMVRTMAGSLVEVGRGARGRGWIGEMLATRDRRRAGPTLPPQGLFLVRVLYPRRFGGDRPPPPAPPGRRLGDGLSPS